MAPLLPTEQKTMFLEWYLEIKALISDKKKIEKLV